MSRAQEGAVIDTAKGQNKTYFNNAQNSYSAANADIGDYQRELADYKGQVSAFSAKNPYTQGGEFQRSTNQIVANTSDANARAAGQTLQGQALRTGQNSAGAIGATEAMERQGTRDVAGEEAGANQQRIGAEAGYNKEALDAGKGVVGATEVPAQLETTLAGQQGNLGEGALGIQENAAKTPSWMDQFGDQAAKDLADLGTFGKPSRG